MKDSTFLIITTIVGIAALFFSSIWAEDYYNPEDGWEFCERNRPEWNKTGERGDICFTTYWNKYCEIRAPSHCPERFIFLGNLS